MTIGDSALRCLGVDLGIELAGKKTFSRTWGCKFSILSVKRMQLSPVASCALSFHLEKPWGEGMVHEKNQFIYLGLLRISVSTE
jgi:hypothetical protein